LSQLTKERIKNGGGGTVRIRREGKSLDSKQRALNGQIKEGGGRGTFFSDAGGKLDATKKRVGRHKK